MEKKKDSTLVIIGSIVMIVAIITSIALAILLGPAALYTIILYPIAYCLMCAGKLMQDKDESGKSAYPPTYSPGLIMPSDVRSSLPRLSAKTEQILMKVGKIPQICGNCNLFKIQGPNPFGMADSGICTIKGKPVAYKSGKCSVYKINLVLPLIVGPELYRPEIYSQFASNPLGFLKKLFPMINDDQYLSQFGLAVMMNRDRILDLARYF